MKLNKTQLYLILGVVIVICIPLVAMLFTTEVKWSFFDFVLAAVLLLFVALLCEFLYRKINNIVLKIITCSLVIITCILFWIEIA
ncbi:MAG TPA: hypothetical protein PLY81_07480, partial [Chitinophagaceae bacterium]|nr:hypothetical protein [Chitinophagaceae bacterium]